MAHTHSVYDDDSYFDIDPSSRTIEYVGEDDLVISQTDHDSEQYTFKMPRYIDGHDMTLCNLAEVHYINISSENRSQRNVGIYTITDLEVDPEDENSVIFTWLVSQNATMHIGSLNFACRFSCMLGSVIDYAWSTKVFSAIAIAESINNSNAVAVQYADILQAWYLELIAGSSLGVSGLKDAMTNAIAEIEAAKRKAIDEIEAVETIHQITDEALVNIADAETAALDNIDKTTARISDAEAAAIARIQEAADDIVNGIPRYAGETEDVT